MNKGQNQIMISYRREDSAGVTGRIYDVLVQKFGEEDVFKDVDSIPLGVNFKSYLEKVLKQCKVLVVIIGDRWLDIKNSAGSRRLDHSQDVVRLEIETALLLGVSIIPVLVQNAKMPEVPDLPQSLQELAYINGTTVGNDPYFHIDMNRLIKGLEYILQPKSDSKAIDLKKAILSLHNLIASQEKNNFLGKFKYEDTFLWTNKHFFEIALDIPEPLKELFPLKANPLTGDYIRNLQNKISSEYAIARVVSPPTKEGYIELTSKRSQTNVLLNPIYYEYLTARYPDAHVMVGATYDTVCLFVEKGHVIAGIIGVKF